MSLRAAALAAMLAVALNGPGTARADAAAEARAALTDLQAATQILREASGRTPRITALTKAIRATEAGLAAIRDSQRRTIIAERALSEQLNAQDAETARFLGSLQAVGSAGSPTVFLHPSGATGTARAAMLLAEIGPVLHGHASQLRSDVENLRELRALQTAAAETMQKSLSELQSARDALNSAVAARTDLPQRFLADPVRQAILLASTETLDGFAEGLAQIVAEGSETPFPEAITPAPGSLPLPVLGVVLRAANEPDLAGVARPGIVMATRPYALVTAPMAATLRYIGPLLDFGEVSILEPSAGHLLILAGLGTVYGQPGQVIAKGDPLGIMGPNANNSTDISSTGGEQAGPDLSQTLYIEVRQDNVPMDPASWFALGKDKQESK